MSNTFTSDILIVGGGQSGVQVAISLRELNFDGSITIIEAGLIAPYERPPLTKAYLRGERSASDLAFRQDSFWGDSDIALRLGETVKRVDPATRTVTTVSGNHYQYGSLVWAAGGRARELPLAQGIEGVLSVRTRADADILKASIGKVRSVAVIGGGFIGLEAASVLSSFGITLTILEAQDRLLARVTSAPVSEFFARLHRSHGCDVRLNVVIDVLESENQHVTGVRLATGETIPADLVIVGIGLIPNVEPLAEAGIKCSNGVDTDETCRTSAPNIFAVGDCANRVSEYSSGARVRLESVPNAVELGKLVAAEIAGSPHGVETPPWFWSHQYETKLQTVGLFNGHDAFIVRGDSNSSTFSVIYLREGEVIAVDSINNVRDFAQAKRLVSARVEIPHDILSDPTIQLKDMVS